MSGRPSSSSSQPIFQTAGSPPFVIRPEDSNSPFPNGKHPLANTFTVSPRSSPAPSDQRGSEAAASTNGGTGNIGSLGSIGSIGDPVGQSGPRFNPPIFRSSFTDDYQGPIHRALDPIPPDQREPFITVDSPPSSNTSPSYRVNEGERPYPLVETHASSKDRSISGHIETTDDVSPLPALGGPSIFRQGSLGPGISPFSLQRQNSLSNNLTPRQSVSQDNFVSSTLSGPGIPLNAAIGNSSIPDAVLASSPVSTGSAPSANSFIIGANDKSIDAQIKNSPFLHDILDRVIRTEYAQRDLSREIGALANKVNLLVDRLELGDSRRSFSASPRPGGMMGGNYPGSPPGGPLHHNPGGREEGDISKRLDALTNSVQQILMIQQQNHLNATNAPFRDNGSISPSVGPGGFDQMPPMLNMPGGPGMMGPPNRPQGRNPAPPMRTWSAGSLDLPMRQDNPHLARPDALINQKRRSVVGNLARRDSSATVDSDWGNNSPRDTGPTITKWEHLQLVPDLLRSISKYGVGPPNKIQQRALPFLLNGADIIAQAPPTQERIAAYVIPAIHIALTSLATKPQNRGPIVVIISTTVDQATQAQRMIRDLGGAIGVRSALGVGTGGDVQQEIRLLQQSVPHILCGTPQKLHSLFTTPGGLPGNEVRFLVLDEVDQLIARNLHDFVFNIVKLLPPPRPTTASIGGSNTPSPNPTGFSPFGNPGEMNNSPNSTGSGNFSNGSRRFPPLVHSPNPNDPPGSQGAITKRQTALFSNTVPQDVLNLANAIQLRDPVRVLVRRDGNVTSTESHKGPSGGLKQFYLYLAFTATGGRIDNNTGGTGLGIIGSGRANTTTAETAQAKEWKLDALADLFDDIEVAQTIVHVGSVNTLDAVVYKLASRGLEAVALHAEMSPATKMAALNKFRGGNNSVMMKQQQQQQPSSRVLVVFDVQVKSPDVFQVPLIINYDLPKQVEDYAHRVAPAMSSNYSRPGVVVNFVTATGGDVEMLRSIECFYKIKCPEVPISLRDVL